MPAVNGILETAIYVDDVRRSADFYRDLLGCEVLVQDDRFCALSIGGKDVLLLFRRGASRQPISLPGGVVPPHDGSGTTHFAFTISAGELEAWRERLGDRLESTVHWERGGTSLYFRDPDGHCVEVVTPGCWSIY
ncbi:MAG: VOC family protein [Bryobacteraceae bacterium]